MIKSNRCLHLIGALVVLIDDSFLIAGISFLASIDSYVFGSFLKTVTLVITIGALHGLLILLPILHYSLV